MIVGGDAVSSHGPDHLKAPILERLLRHAEDGRARFHVPGHKGRPDLDAWRLDLTELPALDDLHHPAPGGMIAEAQDLAARAYGAAGAYFLVGGSTSGVLAMALAAVAPGELLLVTLPCHRSVAAAAVLSGCRLGLVRPRLLPYSGLPAPAPSHELEAAIRQARPSAVLVTTPTYHGIAAPLEPAAEACAGLGVPLLVDAAHGAHLGFAPCYPVSPVRYAAVSVMSLHKTAGALTPGALLLLGGGKSPDRRRLESALRLIQTSSPPFPVLASLDASRRALAVQGAVDWTRVRELCDRTRREVSRQTRWLRALEVSVDDGLALDPARLVFTIDPTAPDHLTGTVLAGAVSRRGVDLELVGWSHVVAIAGPADTEDDHRRLVATLVAAEGEAEAMPSRFEGPRRELAVELEKDCWKADQEWVLSPADAFRRVWTTLPVADAAGRVAAEAIAPYPPGVPLVFPGQRISTALTRYLSLTGSSGVPVYGVSGSEVEIVG